MGWTGRGIILALTVAAILVSSNRRPLTAQAVTTLLSQNWDGGTSGWTLQNSNSAVRWAADGMPTGTTVGTPFQSSPNSLNYNDNSSGTYFAVDSTGADAPSSGSVTSGTINLAGTTNPTLTFWCNYETEPGSEDPTAWGGVDLRSLRISSDNFATTVLDNDMGELNQGSSVGACQTMGTWHQHTITLNPSWGAVRIRFAFDSVDELYNDYAGWFVDNILVTATSGGPGPGPGPAPVPGGGGGGGGGGNHHSIFKTLCGGGVLAATSGGLLWTLAAVGGLLLFARPR